MTVRFLQMLVSLLAVLASVAVAQAEDAPYVGTWAADPTNCGEAQDSASAPLVIARNRYDQHETHCEFTAVEAQGSDFKVAAQCAVEGDERSETFTLTVSGDTLTYTDAAGSRDLLRCK